MKPGRGRNVRSQIALITVPVALVLSIGATQPVQGQTRDHVGEGNTQPGPEQTRDYLGEGNSLLEQGRPELAEAVFREAIVAEPDRSDVFRAQVALSLINQGNFEAADLVLESLQGSAPGDPAVAWYYSLSSYFAQDFVEAIQRFEAAIPILESAGSHGQVYGAYFFIGESYYELLRSDGLSQAEVDAMLHAYEFYLAHAPPDAATPAYVDRVQWLRDNRPSENVLRWIHRY